MMPLIKCRVCGATIARSALWCPRCGAQHPEDGGGPGAWFLGCLFLCVAGPLVALLLFMLGCGVLLMMGGD